MKSETTAARPPMQDGVSASCVVLPAGPWATLAQALAARIPMVSEADWLARLGRGEVFDARAHTLPPEAPHRANAKVWYYRQVEAEARIPFDERVLFQDAQLLAVDKPHFLPVTPKGRYVQETLLVRLKRRLGIETLVPMHRLDRDTAGVMLFTLQPGARHAYQSLFAARAVHKVYEAMAPWREALAQPLSHHCRLEERPGDAFMQMAVLPGEPNAHTDIEMVERRGDWALYRLRPHTGRKHQLRAVMASLGAPLVGDRLYPVLQPAEAELDFSAPLQLLACEIAFTDPFSGARRRFGSQRTLQAWAALNPGQA